MVLYLRKVGTAPTPAMHRPASTAMLTPHSPAIAPNIDTFVSILLYTVNNYMHT